MTKGDLTTEMGYGEEAALRLMAEAADRQEKDTDGREQAAERLIAAFIKLGGSQRRPGMQFSIKEYGGGAMVYLPEKPGAHRDFVFVVYRDGKFKILANDRELDAVELTYDTYLRNYVTARPKNESDVPRPPLAELVYALLKATNRIPVADVTIV